ncbi:hydrogenase iron-sulfur subunit [Chloroflexota bacterium]
MTENSDWEPRILGLLCKWCSYAGADLAGTSRKKYPANIRIIRVPCTGRVDPLLVLKALRLGYDGVLVSGCHPGDCHYQTGNFRARRRMAVTKRFLEYMGVEPARLQVAWCSASEGEKFAEVVTELTDELSKIGPNRLFKEESERDTAKATR